jgi:hypothetical protein
MQITHEEVRKLIQFNADDALKPFDKNTLLTHLETCAECQAYAKSIRGMESILRPLLQRKWDQQPVPLSVSSVRAQRDDRISERMFMATRIAAFGMICVTFVFSIWQFTLSNQRTQSPLLASVPPVPTPSTQLISTTGTVEHCDNRIYIVKETDTLESIAFLFSISKEEIMAANSMKTEILSTRMEITVPVCTSTPTGTVNALTTTYTPAIRLITSTPGG